jgi:non-specific serine/threonine protein kinase/serine/threonine-protein kinase
MNELDANAKRIFLEAIEQNSPQALAEFLNTACAGNEALRSRVEELLRAHERAGGFLGGLLTGTTAEPARSEGVGTAIGPYKLLEQIGEGGFGVVFLAEQHQPVRRKVALKILKPGMDSRQVIARFEAERQALALMDHPNIARVLDAGQTASGRPYFVMELVKGVPITQFCDEQHLSPRERLEVVVSVCRAVQHAHQKGIIHRDLKPTNVLIASYDGRPVPKVIDFGVAKALGQQLTERTLVTGFGGIVGTLEYMSPEQAEFNALDVDTRADVYSLGVLLYELLTGTTPLTPERLKQAAISEALRLIREEDPPRPSNRLSESKDSLASISAQRKLEPTRLARELRGELDWIVMKALEKDRDRRYSTPAALAEDVDRYLRREAILARPPSLAYRLAKFCRRNRAVVLGLTTIAAALLVGTTVAVWQAVAATRARNEANAKEAETRAVLDFVDKRIMAAARPEGQASGLGHEVTLRLALEAALPVVDTSFAGQPLIEARLRMTLGDSFRYLGEPRIAADQYQRARALYLEELGPDDNRTLESVSSLADSYASLGKLPEALTLREDTLARRRRTLGPDHRDTLRSMHSLAKSYAEHGKDDEALKLDEQTLEIQKARLGLDDPDTLASMTNRALGYASKERFTEALEQFQEVLALRRKKYGPTHPDTLLTMNHLANAFENLREYKKALELRLETLELQKTKLGPDHPDTVTTLYNLANTYGFLKQPAEALKCHQQALAIREAKFGPYHRLTLWSKWGVAAELYSLGRETDAIAVIDEVFERAQHMPVQPDLVGLANNRSRYYETTKNAAGCRKTAELWENLHRTDARSLYNAACYRGVAAKVIRATDSSPAGAQAFVTEANRAMAWLQQALAAGYKKVSMLKQDSDLDALRDRADFQKAIADLEAAAEKEKK